MVVPDDVIVNGYRVAYGDHGPADGAPVVLVHGQTTFRVEPGRESNPGPADRRASGPFGGCVH